MSIRRSAAGEGMAHQGPGGPAFAQREPDHRARPDRAVGGQEPTSFAFNANYLLQLRRKGIRLPLGGIAGVLPGFMRRGELGKGLARADFSLFPTRVTLTSGLTRDEANSTAFRFPVARSDDDNFLPTLALTHLWRNGAGLTWQPLGMLNLSGDLVSTRDLRIYPDSSPLGRLAYSERRFLLGIPVGVERDRT